MVHSLELSSSRHLQVPIVFCVLQYVYEFPCHFRPGTCSQNALAAHYVLLTDHLAKCECCQLSIVRLSILASMATPQNESDISAHAT